MTSLRIVQDVVAPCAMCVLMSQLSEISSRERRAYQQHLAKVHGIKPYYIPK